MGLQFIDANGTERTLTVADMLTDDFAGAYSDLYKGLNGFRPRGATPEQMLHFFDTYEEAFKAHEAEEAAELARHSALDGIEYRNWSHFYDVKEREMEESYDREREAREEAQDLKERFNARFSPLPAIEAWEYGRM